MVRSPPRRVRVRVRVIIALFITENMKNVSKTSVREKGVYDILAHYVQCA